MYARVFFKNLFLFYSSHSKHCIVLLASLYWAILNVVYIQYGVLLISGNNLATITNLCPLFNFIINLWIFLPTL